MDFLCIPSNRHLFRYNHCISRAIWFLIFKYCASTARALEKRLQTLLNRKRRVEGYTHSGRYRGLHLAGFFARVVDQGLHVPLHDHQRNGPGHETRSLPHVEIHRKQRYEAVPRKPSLSCLSREEVEGNVQAYRGQRIACRLPAPHQSWH